jgi:hypothetical protein
MEHTESSRRTCVLLRIKTLDCDSGDGGDIAEFLCSPPLFDGNPYICVTTHHAEDGNTYVTVSACVPDEFHNRVSTEDEILGEILQNITQYDEWMTPVSFMDDNDYGIYVLESMSDDDDDEEHMLDYATQLLSDIDKEVKFAVIPPVSLFVLPQK